MKRLTKKQIDLLKEVCALADAAADELTGGCDWSKKHANNVHNGVLLIRKIIEENQSGRD